MITRIKPGIFQFHFRNFGSCVYLLKLEKRIIIDTSTKENRDELLADLQELGAKPEDIDILLLTHNHYDHNGNIDLFKNAKLYSYENSGEIPFKEIKVIKVPGHTRDSIAFLYKDVLFSGDTLFHNGIGRTDLPESQPEKMEGSLEKLRKLKYKILCPGHIK